jgi:hypothetical protein
MKRLIIIIIILLSINIYSQVSTPPEFGNLKLSVSQDLKFMTVGDKDKGYDAYTRDIIVRMKLEDANFLTLGIQGLGVFEYENADLLFVDSYGNKRKGFERWTLGLGFAFDNRMSGRRLGAHDMWWRHTTTVQYGWINRSGFTTDTFVFDLEHSTRIVEGLCFVASHQLMKRSDLALLYKNYGVWKYSFFVGLEIDIANIF